ncbi:MAG: PD-(D/E)XK nuclease family protein, partial [Tannerella sp.]|nr:PD-(D/E)XK nuclease family protein [Tannerella sp.]
MKPFLKQVADTFYDMHGAELKHLAFIFPNRRSGVFFKKYLDERAVRLSAPAVEPAIMTISDLFYRMNNRQPVDHIKLLFMLYDIYRRQSHSDETFDDFCYMGEMLLGDFDDIDKYMVDARQLFTNVENLNDISRDFAFLTESQVQAIRSFWSSFQPESGQPDKQSFLRVWSLLYPVYRELREKLAGENMAYEGMVYREVIENIESMVVDYEKLVFVGLNALTSAEKALLGYLQKEGKADFYWDYLSDMLKDPDNRASFFLRDNTRLFPSEYPLAEDETLTEDKTLAEEHPLAEDETLAEEYPFAEERPLIETVGIPSRIGQAKQLYPLLRELSSAKDFDPLKTAIVLPDEKLLMPVLNSIPENISCINVTLGYSLNGTPIASLTASLQSLQKNRRETGDAVTFYHRDVAAILRHKYVNAVCPAEAASLIKDIRDNNKVYVSPDELGLTPFLKLLFTSASSPSGISDYLMAVLTELQQQEVDTLEHEFINTYYNMVGRMREMIEETRMEMTGDTYFRLLKQMTDMIKIPFEGEPLSGLQVMGVLETRALDFENIIILSVNEGVFPSRSASNSFIPYHLRRGFGLPTPEYHDSVR